MPDTARLARNRDGEGILVHRGGNGEAGATVEVELFVVEGGAGDDGGAEDEEAVEVATGDTEGLVKLDTGAHGAVDAVDVVGEEGGVADDGAAEGSVKGEEGAKEFETDVKAKGKAAKKEAGATGDDADEVGAEDVEATLDLEIGLEGRKAHSMKSGAAVQDLENLELDTTPSPK